MLLFTYGTWLSLGELICGGWEGGTDWREWNECRRYITCSYIKFYQDKDYAAPRRTFFGYSFQFSRILFCVFILLLGVVQLKQENGIGRRLVSVKTWLYSSPVFIVTKKHFQSSTVKQQEVGRRRFHWRTRKRFRPTNRIELQVVVVREDSGGIIQQIACGK